MDAYVQQGLHSNLLLQQKHLGLEKAQYSLKAASSLFMPSVGLSGTYTHGQGGRTIAIPVGDMLNPVYATLNQLTESQHFPQIENVEQSFFPRHFYDVRMRTSMPLLNTSLQHNRSIRQEQLQLQEWEVKIYERELILHIKQAYWGYLSALEAVRIWESALELVQKNLAVNESLLRNGSGLPASVLRAQSELEGVKAQLLEAQNKAHTAQRYFNFLLNRDQTSAIEAVERPDERLEKIPQLLLQAEGEEGGSREELQQLRTGERLQSSLLRLSQQQGVPTVGAFLDLGLQAENMAYTKQAPYFLMGLSLDMPLFSGFRNRYEVRQARLDLKSSQLQLDHTRQQLQLAARTARNELATAYQHQAAARQRLIAATSYFRLLERGYAEGTYSLIEFIDARNQLTSAQLQQSITTYQVLSALAQYERQTAHTTQHP
ncbi:TolC family protein [Cesiribacter andamanensis]|uniref:TolC family protein n=1 Tax=Cesiribacter andamanensis TaxID=649507 RepID=UPI000688A557|nr:TolC family protein [Cesiribacter andamanensis]